MNKKLTRSIDKQLIEEAKTASAERGSIPPPIR